MKKILFAAVTMMMAAIVLSACGASSRTIVPSDKTVTQNFDLSGFDAVRVSNFIKAEISIGDRYDVSLTGADNLVGLVELQRKGRTLVAQFKDQQGVSVRNGGHDTVLCLHVTLPSLSAVTATGQADVHVVGPLTSSRLRLTSSGQAEIVVSDVEASGVEAAASGQSEINVGGVIAPTVSVTASGQSDVRFGRIMSPSVQLASSGQASIRVNGGEVNDCRASASGQSDIDMGDCRIANRTKSVSGQASVR